MADWQTAGCMGAGRPMISQVICHVAPAASLIVLQTPEESGIDEYKPPVLSAPFPPPGRVDVDISIVLRTLRLAHTPPPRSTSAPDQPTSLGKVMDSSQDRTGQALKIFAY